jgi:A/G-specific adenine glycosylase
MARTSSARRLHATQSFSSRVVAWQREHGRRGLPWQSTRDAYRIWLSEVMLQQTQVATVIPYYERFLARFPDVASLAAAPEDDVLALWSGLGYYARARNLHRAARDVARKLGGIFPATSAGLLELPGIGRSTAAAIAAFASGERGAILDGNVRRVLARHAGIGGDPASAQVIARLWSEAEARLPPGDIETYTQGMMDLGADICVPRKPRCLLCPVAGDCVARIANRIEELPGRRARAPARRKRIAMIVVISRGEVLVEKRPASGIWGGLWSLPECGADEPAREFLAREWGLEAATADPLEPFEHAFTHFTLEVAPWRVELGKASRLAEGKQGAWLAVSDLAGAALPSPVRKLLQRLVSETN